MRPYRQKPLSETLADHGYHHPADMGSSGGKGGKALREDSYAQLRPSQPHCHTGTKYGQATTAMDMAAWEWFDASGIMMSNRPRVLFV